MFSDFKILFFVLLASFYTPHLIAQNAQILSENEVKQVFTSANKTKLGITFNIFRVYRYAEQGSNYLIALTENTQKVTAQGDTLVDKIKGYCIKETEMSKVWELNDFTTNMATSPTEKESSIWFWTKYCEIKDLDKDGLVEPIIVYGTKGINGYGDGRIKILVYYKGKKSVIRHQNGVLDSERNSQVDATFYALPITIQNQVKSIMKSIEADEKGIFPAEWESQMKGKKLKLAE